MTCAYDRVYLTTARSALGRMLDFAVHELGYELGRFFDLFLSTGVAERFEVGDYRVLVGMSGVELVWLVLDSAGVEHQRIAPSYTADRSAEYWTGWALAYYQWCSGLTFRRIVAVTPIDQIRELYWPCHEMDIRQFVDKMNERYLSAAPPTNLKQLRQQAQLTQRQLAQLSGVPLRTIQQYEQRQKHINNAQAGSLNMLAQVLHCTVSDLLEYTP